MRAVICIFVAVSAILGTSGGQVSPRAGFAVGTLVRASAQYPEPHPRTVALFTSYISKFLILQAAPADRRPAKEILSDLRKLPRDQKLALRGYLLTHSNWGGEGIDLLAQLLPEGHRQFLMEALDNPQLFNAAAKGLAAYNDPAVVPMVLKRAGMQQGMAVSGPNLNAYVKPIFRSAIVAEHTARPTMASAHLIGLCGRQAEKQIRQTASADPQLRMSVFFGLAESENPGAASLLLDLADFSNERDRFWVGYRFASEGESRVPMMVQWLNGTPAQQDIAGYVLVRIKSSEAVTKALAHLEQKTFPNDLAAQAAKSSPTATRTFIIDRLAHGNTVQKMNALLLAHHLAGYDRPVAGVEHPLLPCLLATTYDSDPEVRWEAAKRATEFAYNAEHSDGMRVLRRLVELFSDPSPRVRSEAAIQATQYPCPEVLPMLKKMAADSTEDPRVRDSVSRAANSLERSLASLKSRGAKAVHLSG